MPSLEKFVGFARRSGDRLHTEVSVSAALPCGRGARHIIRRSTDALHESVLKLNGFFDITVDAGRPCTLSPRCCTFGFVYCVFPAIDRYKATDNTVAIFSGMDQDVLCSTSMRWYILPEMDSINRLLRPPADKGINAKVIRLWPLPHGDGILCFHRKLGSMGKTLF